MVKEIDNSKNNQLNQEEDEENCRYGFFFEEKGIVCTLPKEQFDQGKYVLNSVMKILRQHKK